MESKKKLLGYIYMSEMMFEKERPKKELSKRQKDALAKGRAKLKQKRIGTIIEENEVSIPPPNPYKARQREERLLRQKVLDEKREIDIYNKLMKKGNDKINRFKELKYNWLDQAPSMKEYNDFKGVLDTITEEDILTDNHLSKLEYGLDSFRVIADTNDVIAEEEEEERPITPPPDLDNVVDIY
tara:strand:- start:8256 stop:8807 length:552 start_codon:yes stop_codon:yes gene_type:complete